jgi:hypothetical protein
MRGMYYNRKGEEIELLEWAALVEDPEYKIVEQTECEGITVSTVWLGLNHNFSGAGAPLIFETMVFGGPIDEYQDRYSTEDEAREGHAAMIEQVNKALNGKLEV